VDSFRFVICGSGECRQLFFLCRHCDRGDRYCSRTCAERARRASRRAAGRRYQLSRRGRFRHAARQARYRTRRPPPEKVTHQTSPGADRSGIVATSPLRSTLMPSGDKEDTRDAEPTPQVPLAAPVRCARCGRPGRFVRHTTWALLRPRPRRSRR
jgi:hypothetical protein